MTAVGSTIGLALGPVEGVTTARTHRVRPGALISVLFLLVLAAAVAFPSVLSPYNPLTVNPARAFLGPSLHHLFGTDPSGRDQFSRVVYGARSSLSIGLLATALGMGGAIVLGLLAGLGGRATDFVISRVLEVLFAFPALLLALLLVSLLGASVTTLVFAVGLGSVPGYARMIRGQVMAVRNAPYVEAAAVFGHSRWQVISRTIFPNAMRPLIVLATLGVGQSIVWASTLSFLGLGAAPPAPEWGALLSAGRDYVSTAWWLEFFPGAVIVAFTLATTALGRYLQRRMEGRTP
jgi:peptide/nickel transport system permease protein